MPTRMLYIETTIYTKTRKRAKIASRTRVIELHTKEKNPVITASFVIPKHDVKTPMLLTDKSKIDYTIHVRG